MENEIRIVNSLLAYDCHVKVNTRRARDAPSSKDFNFDNYSNINHYLDLVLFENHPNCCVDHFHSVHKKNFIQAILS